MEGCTRCRVLYNNGNILRVRWRGGAGSGENCVGTGSAVHLPAVACLCIAILQNCPSASSRPFCACSSLLIKNGLRCRDQAVA
jgi:hypothetical protein